MSWTSVDFGMFHHMKIQFQFSPDFGSCWKFSTSSEIVIIVFKHSASSSCPESCSGHASLFVIVCLEIGYLEVVCLGIDYLEVIIILVVAPFNWWAISSLSILCIGLASLTDRWVTQGAAHHPRILQRVIKDLPMSITQVTNIYIIKNIHNNTGGRPPPMPPSKELPN